MIVVKKLASWITWVKQNFDIAKFIEFYATRTPALKMAIIFGIVFIVFVVGFAIHASIKKDKTRKGKAKLRNWVFSLLMIAIIYQLLLRWIILFKW